MATVPGYPGDIILSMDYSDEDVVEVFDTRCLGWIVDELRRGDPRPITIGGLPPEADEASSPVRSPQWAGLHEDRVDVPELWRGKLPDFFTWLATNNGAERRLHSNFESLTVSNIFDQWATQNPDLAA